MFETVTEIGFAVALLLPGFLVVQLSERRRPSKPPGGDLELILRGLIYSLIIQALAAVSTWLPWLAHGVSRRPLIDHLSALAAYGLSVCVIAPTVMGLLLGTWLGYAESGGSLRWWHYALGGRDARRAWDYMFSRHGGEWIKVVLCDDDAGREILGKFGTTSWASQSPAEPDLYLQQVWMTDADGQITQAAIQGGGDGGLWINGDRIARIQVLGEGQDS